MADTDKRGNTLYLSDEELSLLWQLLLSANIPGSVAEVYVGLKAQVRVAMNDLAKRQEEKAKEKASF